MSGGNLGYQYYSSPNHQHIWRLFWRNHARSIIKWSICIFIFLLASAVNAALIFLVPFIASLIIVSVGTICIFVVLQFWYFNFEQAKYFMALVHCLFYAVSFMMLRLFMYNYPSSNESPFFFLVVAFFTNCSMFILIIDPLSIILLPGDPNTIWPFQLIATLLCIENFLAMFFL